MKEIDKVFSENIKLCVTASVSDRGLPWAKGGGSETCKKDVSSLLVRSSEMIPDFVSDHADQKVAFCENEQLV